MNRHPQNSHMIKLLICNVVINKIYYFVEILIYFEKEQRSNGKKKDAKNEGKEKTRINALFSVKNVNFIKNNYFKVINHLNFFCEHKIFFFLIINNLK